MDSNAFFDALPTFHPRPAGWEKDVTQLLNTDTFKHLLASFEENALLLEKTALNLDPSLPAVGVELAKLQGRVAAIRDLIDFTINLAQEKEDDSGIANGN